MARASCHLLVTLLLWGCGGTGTERDGIVDGIVDGEIDDLPTADPAGEEVVAGVCGDGDPGGAEECDDGDVDDCNGCSALCRWERSLLVPRGGTGAVVRAPGGSGAVCLPAEFTVEAWFRIDEPLAEELCHLVFYQPGSFGLGVKLDRSGDYQVAFLIQNSGPPVGASGVDVTQAIVPGDWHHLALTSRYEGGMGDVHVHAWFDGRRLDTWLPTSPDWSCENDLHLGYAGGETWAAPFSGVIDDARISGANIYPSVTMTPVSRLEPSVDSMALWTMDAAPAGLVADVTGGGLDAELVDGSLVADECHGSP